MRAAGLALIAASLAAASYSASRLFVASGPGDPPLVFVVAPGEPLSSVAMRLDAAGLLPRGPLFGPAVFVLYARVTGADRDVKSGEYELDPGMPPTRILAKLVAGEVMTHAVVLPEGLRVDEVAARLEQAGILSAADFVRVASDPARARELGIEAEGLEGYLYPETYRFRRGAPPDQVARAMLDEFRARLAPEDAAAIARSGRSLHEIVTLASIVEKETAVPDERPLIAAVFRNRLERGMRLETDPTVIYGIPDFDGNLRRSDLENAENPYNTYRIPHLPPGPIASPGAASLRAVVEPAETEYLYFVSRNDGSHTFSKTYEEHLAAVNRYQRTGGS
jgi:UPF0755 protein